MFSDGDGSSIEVGVALYLGIKGGKGNFNVLELHLSVATLAALGNVAMEIIPII